MLNQADRFKTACWTCRSRKVKCDKRLPCRNCAAAGVACAFPPQTRTVRRPKRAHNGSTGKDDERAIVKRLNRLEALLKKHHLHLQLDDNSGDSDESEDGREDAGEKGPPLDPLDTPKESLSTASFVHTSKGRWIPSPTSMPTPASAPVQSQTQETGDGSGFDGAGYWDRLEEECARQVFLSSPSTTRAISGSAIPLTGQREPAQVAESPHLGFPFRPGGATRPPPLLPLAQRRICWRVYVENIDPVLRILHKPTLEPLISVLDVRCYDLTPSTGALIQAICLLAIVSMSEEDVSANLDNEKDTLRRTSASLTEQALMASEFLVAGDLSTLQALLLFLYYLKHEQDPRFSAMCGVAVSLSVQMGLHRDAALDLSQLEVELRRRLWWQLVILVDHPDDFSLEYYRLSMNPGSRLPRNVDDGDLDVQNPHMSEQHRGFTELSFSLMQCEITRTFNQIRYERTHTNDSSKISIDRAEQRLRSTRDFVESKYFRDCIREKPIVKFASDVVAMILTKRRILVYNASNCNGLSDDFSPDLRDHLFLLGIHVLELSRGLQTTRNSAKWRWLSAMYFQWSVAAIVVKDLAIRPPSPATKRAWHVVNGIFDSWPEATRNSAKAVSLNYLIADAIRNRDARDVWKSSLPSGFMSGHPPFLSPATPHDRVTANSKRRETPRDWVISSAPPDPHQLAFSPIDFTTALENYVVPDSCEDAFGCDFELL